MINPFSFPLKTEEKKTPIIITAANNENISTTKKRDLSKQIGQSQHFPLQKRVARH
uniref:Uncharacterized protein n=1 Tax=Rhizophora mucronata TaxID=61149 RepID=A0A2P2QQ75_RHIMU